MEHQNWWPEILDFCEGKSESTATTRIRSRAQEPDGLFCFVLSPFFRLYFDILESHIVEHKWLLCPRVGIESPWISPET